MKLYSISFSIIGTQKTGNTLVKAENKERARQRATIQQLEQNGIHIKVTSIYLKK